MNRLPMLLIGGFRGEPPITSRARRALHHLNEVLPNLRLFIAASSVCCQPILRWNFNVRGVHLSHRLHRESVDVDVDLVVLFHVNPADFSVEVLDFGGWISRFACLHSSPQHALANLWRDFGREVAELPKAFGNPLFHQFAGCCNRFWNVVVCRTGTAPRGGGTTDNLQSRGKHGGRNDGGRGNENAIICRLPFSLQPEARHDDCRTFGCRLCFHRSARRGRAFWQARFWNRGTGRGGLRPPRWNDLWSWSLDWLWRTHMHLTAGLCSMPIPSASFAPMEAVGTRVLRVRALRTAWHCADPLISSAVLREARALWVHGKQ